MLTMVHLRPDRCPLSAHHRLAYVRCMYLCCVSSPPFEVGHPVSLGVGAVLVLVGGVEVRWGRFWQSGRPVMFHCLTPVCSLVCLTCSAPVVPTGRLFRWRGGAHPFVRPRMIPHEFVR